MNGSPLVAVVTVNWNTAHETIKSAESVLKSDYPNLFLTVVDNGSRAPELELLRSGLPHGVKLLALEKNHGYVGGVNRGLKAGSKLAPEYLMVMNNDTILDSTAINELVKASRRHRDRCIVTGIVYDYDNPEIIQKTGSIYKNKRRLAFSPLYRNVKDPGFSGEDMEMDMIDDVFWLMHKKVFQNVGFYCDHFWFNDEQTDYALRAQKKGYKLIFTPHARIWHMGSLSIGGRKANPVREYFDFKSRLIVRHKHLSKTDFCGFYLETMFILCKGIIKAFISGEDKQMNLRLVKARMLGLRDFHKWLINKKSDSGDYPQSLNRG